MLVDGKVMEKWKGKIAVMHGVAWLVGSSSLRLLGLLDGFCLVGCR